MIFLSVIGLSYIALWGFFNHSIQAGFITIIFGFLLLISLFVALLVLISNGVKQGIKKDFSINRAWRRPCLSFLVFFLIQSLIIYFSGKGGDLSFVTLQKNRLFSLFSTQVPLVADFFINVIMVPIIEELFFLFAIPQIIFMTLNRLSKKWSFMCNKIFQLFVAILVSSILFALFHVGKQEVMFIISAIVIRTIIIILFWGDLFLNFIWFAEILASGMVGIHIGNNWGIYGFINGILILSTVYWGWLLLLLFVIMIISAADYIFDVLKITTGGTPNE